MNEPHKSAGAIFDTAIELPPEQREAYLHEACGSDDALRQRVEALLRAHESAGTFMATAAAAAKATIKLDPLMGPQEDLVGLTIGRYKLLEKIGEGGCGVVYVAEQTEPVRRRVALKVIKLGMDTKAVVGRFEAERQALAMMDHPNIAKVLDAGATERGRLYFVMELVRGIRITEYCDQNQLSTQERLELFIKVCQAIQHAHQKGVIHRDIKPSNIMVTLHDGVPVPKVIDFGIAKATEGRLADATVYTQLHQFIGTPAYMSPEQAEMSGLDIDTRSDIYSLGVLLYELLTGRTPFDAQELIKGGLEAIRRTIREVEPPRPSTRLSTLQGQALTTTAKQHGTQSVHLLRLIRGDLDWIVMKCLEKDRTRRYDTANGLAMDLRRHLENEPIIARPPSTAYRLQKTWRRHKAVVVVAGLMASVLVAATGISVWQAVRATRAQTLAKQRLVESEAISKFLTEVFQSPDPARDGRTITVAETLGAAAKKLETDLASQPARRAELQATLGSTYYELGLYREAIALQEKVRDYYLVTFGAVHPDTLGAMGDLAVYYYAAGRRNEALKLREEVLPLDRKVLGPEHPITLLAMGNLAGSYEAAGRRDEAIQLQEEFLALSRKLNGPEHPDTLVAMNELAAFYEVAGRRDETLKLQEQVLTLSRKVLGPEQPRTLTAMGNLANSYDTAGRRDEAIKLQEEALALRRKVSGPEHPDTLWAMRNLANSYSHTGRRDEALKLRQEVLALRRKVLGSEHPDTLSSMIELGLSYAEAGPGRWDEALKLSEEALALRRKVLGPEHPDTLLVMNQLAFSYDEAGRRDEALKLREEVLALRRKVLGPEHPDTLWAMRYLARSYAEAGRRDEALKLRAQALALGRKVLGPEHPDTLSLMILLAVSYDEAGRRDEALKLREEVLALRRKESRPEDTAVAMQNLAISYTEAGRHQEAIALLEKACEQDPKNTDVSLTLATWQTWFGHDADYEATRRRLVQKAEGTDDANTAHCAAKAYCLRPSTDSTLLTKALNLAQRSVELGKSSPFFPWYQQQLGRAEYCNGRYVEAERILTVAEQAGGDNDKIIRAGAGLFRAMTLFRQGKSEEARKLFSQAEAEMPPLPKDESKPLVDGRSLNHDVLIWWLAYKEAKSVLNEPGPTQP